MTLINDTIDPTACAGVAPPGGVGLFKVFGPSRIEVGGTSLLTITFVNADAAVATLTAPFTDNLPAGMVVAETPSVATTCGGVAALTALPGDSAVTLPAARTIPGGSVAIPGFCTLTVNVTAPLAGSYLNTVAAGALQTTVGNSTGSSISAELIVAEVTGVPALSGRATIALALLVALSGFGLLRRQGN